MPRYFLSSLLLALLGLLPTASSVRASQFDLIWADHWVVTTYPSNIGFTLADYGFGLVVNTGAADIEGPEFFGTTFTVVSSDPAVLMHVFINNPGPPITPIHPNEALGSVTAANAMLTTKLNHNETLHNTAGMQVLALNVSYPPGYVGSATFDVTMTMGGDVVHFRPVVDLRAGTGLAIDCPSASRTTSTPFSTPTRMKSWGKLKSEYR